MIKFMSIVCVAFAGFSWAVWADLLPSHNPAGKLVLTPQVKEAFKNLPYKSMTPLNRDDFTDEVLSLYKKEEKASPSLAFGDFNGDHKQDAVILLKSKEQAVVAVLLLQEKNSLKAVELNRWPPNPESNLEVTYLSLLPAKEVKFAKKKIKTPRDLIQVETYLGEVKAYYVENGKVHPYKGVVP